MFHKRCAFFLFSFLLLSTVFVKSSVAEMEEICMYESESGVMKQVISRARVPLPKREYAKCFQIQKGTYLAKPEEVKLKGTQRREDMASAVGRIKLRWPRKAESLFGRTPQRAMSDAAQAVSRALKRGGFPIELQRLDLDWSVVFLDADLPDTQIPAYLLSNCHPGWMTPPANIYIVAQRIVSGCGQARKVATRVADAELAEVLIHEMGHAVEAFILKGATSRSRATAEGFATWFESYAADFSKVIPKGSVRREHFRLAKASYRQQPQSFVFTGTAYDYSRASLVFHAIVERKRIYGLMKVYEGLSSGQDILSAVKSKLGWNEKRLNKEISKVLMRG